MITIPPRLRGGAEKDLLVVQENPFGNHPPERQPARFGRRARQRDRRPGKRRLTFRDQPLLPLQPLELPDTEAEAGQDNRDRDQRRHHPQTAKAHAEGGPPSR